MMNALLDEDTEGTATVIVVDWGGGMHIQNENLFFPNFISIFNILGSSPPYTQAVANIRLVGAIAAHVIHMIYEEMSLPNTYKIHMIGHSLGMRLSLFIFHFSH